MDGKELISTERILQILGSHSGKQGLHTNPEIPDEIMQDARAICEVPEDEEVLGIIDCTWSGSAKYCLIFGRDSLYYSNRWTCKTPGTGRVDYSDLTSGKAFDTGFSEIGIGNGLFLDVSDSPFPKQDVIDILNEIIVLARTAIAKRRRRNLRPGIRVSEQDKT
jgi:hypothetical protein